MEIGIAYDLKSDFGPSDGEGPEDRLEEYDSEATVSAIAQALEKNGHVVRKLGGGRRFLERILERPPQLVFNIAEGYGTRSREAHVPGVLEMLRIPHTHSDPLTLAVTLEKGIAKRLVAAAGVPTPRFLVVDRADAHHNLRYPVIAKPLFEGSSMGIRNSSRSTGEAELRLDLERLLGGYRQPVLIEEFCPGPEFTVGVLGTDATARVIAVMEIAPRRARPEEFIYSLEAKRNYEEEVAYRIPPDRPAAMVHAVEEVALGAYRALGCRDVGRVDVRVGADGQPKFLEVNPLPGLNPVTGDIVILSRASGLSYEGLIGAIVANACARLGL